MFKLKPGNVFQKMNKMDRKQAYTLGAIVVVVFVALITMASFLGKADDSSFDGFNSRGYDLAQMPFVNDEAEEYLLASKYPDMQGNNSTMLYSSSEKEERQAEDAAQAEEEEASTDTAAESSSADSSYSGYSGRGYSGRGGARTPTQIGQLGSASMRSTGGSGISATWGAPKGDFSPYKSQDKGTESPLQLKNTDAKKALSQFARGSAAAAGLKDGKSINAKRALMGAGIKGSEAFSETGGVDLSKTAGLNLDTNAPVSSADLSNLDKKIDDANQRGKDEKKKEEEKFGNSLANDLWKQVLTKVVDIGMQQLSQGIDTWMANMSANKAGNNYASELGKELLNKDVSALTPEEKALVTSALGKSDLGTGTVRDAWKNNGVKQSEQKVPTMPTKPSKQDYMTSSSDNGSEQVLDKTRWNAAKEQYQKDKQAYDKYNSEQKDEAVAFGKMMKPTLAQGSDKMSRQYQSTRVAAYNSRAKHSKQEVVEVTPMQKSSDGKLDTSWWTDEMKKNHEDMKRKAEEYRQQKERDWQEYIKKHRQQKPPWKRG
ncbi:hypothetical protein [Candidatus Avelusimicrobium stercoris]|uniref:hypothetical protein n=1 Tax=Candidatus Avelusimicrobium stercoris TaxID=1947924 RepID=UPI003D11EA3C